MRQFLRASQERVAWLDKVIEGGNHFRSRVTFPSTFTPKSGEVVFEAGPGGHGYLLHFLPDPISYHGHNQHLAGVIQRGPVWASSLDGIFAQIEGMESEFSESGNEGSVLPVELVTDLVKAREFLQQPDQHVLDPGLLQQALQERVIGQDDSLALLANHVANFTARRVWHRPANALLLGPTGTGKTETAVALAEFLKRQPRPYEFVRIDCNELNLQHQVARITGAPAGYVGYNDVPEIVQAVRRTPRVLVLVDEVEKGHPDILRVLMTLMDSGRLSTAQAENGGHQVDFSQAILLFTANIAAVEFEQMKRASSDQQSFQFQEQVRSRLIQHGMLPEIAGRFQCFLVFNGLTVTDLLKIVSLHILRLASDYGFSVKRIDPKLVGVLTTEVMSSPAHVRGASHGIERQLAKPLANFRQRFPDGHGIELDGDLNDIRVTGSQATVPAQISRKESTTGEY